MPVPMPVPSPARLSIVDRVERDPRLHALASALRSSPRAWSAVQTLREHVLRHQDVTWLAPLYIDDHIRLDAAWLWMHVIDRRMTMDQWRNGGALHTMSGDVLHVRPGGREMVSVGGGPMRRVGDTMVAHDGELVLVDGPRQVGTRVIGDVVATRVFHSVHHA